MSVLEGWCLKDLECCLYVVCCWVEKCFENDEYFYIVSLFGLVIVYKGLMMFVDLFNFYLDLVDICMISVICVFY